MSQRRNTFALLTLLIAAACSTPDQAPTGVRPDLLSDEALYTTNPAGDPDMRVHHVRPELPGTASPFANPGGGSSPLMTNHGGIILTSSTTNAIFWGPSWSDPSFAGDKLTGLDAFYRGYGGSNYAGTNTEYTASNGQVGTASTFGGLVIDLSTAPRNAPRTSTVLAEVCKHFPTPTPNGYYAVYATTRRGGAGYCAWHSAGSCNGTPIEFAWFFNLDGDSGCDPVDNTTGHSQGLAALANVSGHELSETVTDPKLDAWYDASGAENSDKCAWRFGAPSLTFSNGSKWKLQGNWSNAAYTAGTGFANSSGQKGCLGTV